MTKTESINKSKTTKALFKNTGIIAIGQVSTKIVNFFLLPLYTAILSPAEYGLVDLLTTYSTLLIVIIGLQMNQAVFRFLVTSREDNQEKKCIISTITFATIFVCLLYICMFVPIQIFITLEYKWYLLFYVIVALSLQTTSGIARGLGYNAYYATANFLSASTALVLNVLFIVILRWSVGWMLVAYIIGPAVGTAFLILEIKIDRYISFTYFNKKKLREILQYAIPLIPNELSWSMIHASDRMVIAAFLSIAATGLLSVATKFSVIYTTAFSIFNTSWTEQVILHYRDNGGKEYISSMFIEMVTFFACIAIGIIAVMPFIFPILINSAYVEAYPLIPLYMIAVFFNAIIGLISTIYLVENETKAVAVSTMLAAVINILVDILLINFIGIYAAPIAGICSYASMSLWRLWDINRRHCRITMPLSRILILIGVLLMSLAGFFSNQFIHQIIIFILVMVISVYLNKNLLINLMQLLKIRR